jgi:hypothetical protein
MTDIPDKVARAKELIEQKKRELAENIKKVTITQKNEELKKKEREKEIERKKKEVEKIKQEKGIHSKSKAPEPPKPEAEASSVYISDFESESGSELIERRLGDQRNLDCKPIAKEAYIPIAEVEEDIETSCKHPRKDQNIESLETDVQEKVLEYPKPCISKPVLFQHTFKPESFPVKSQIMSLLNSSIQQLKSTHPLHPSAEVIKKQAFFASVAEIFEEEGFGSNVRLKKNAKKKACTFPTVTVYAPDQSRPKEIFSDQFSTPSFSEKDIYEAKDVYNKFETFGQNNPLKQENILKKDEDVLEMIVVENDDELVREEKMKRLEGRRVKRLEELEKRITKKTYSPDRIVLNEKITFSGSPVPSPKPSPRPSAKIESRNSPRPTHKNREEVKSFGDKYKRHKNLPNLVYNKPSNRKIVKNAIAQVCLAGDPNKVHREEVLALIERLEDVQYFIIVFSDSIRRDVRGLYSHDSNTGEVIKVYGPGYLPDKLDPSTVSTYFRYDSGAKEFKLLQCKDFIVATDAVCLKKIHKVYENN